VLAAGALAAAGLAAGLPASAGAQTSVELRGSTAAYRFADVNHTFENGRGIVAWCGWREENSELTALVALSA